MQQPLKIVIFSSSCMCLPLVNMLQNKHLLVGVVVTVSTDPLANADTQQLVANLQAMSIPIASFSEEESLAAELDSWQTNMGVVFNFPKRIPYQIVNYFAGEIFNIHASDLPNYRGSMPVYWQLRHNLDETKLTLHRLVQQFDSGDIGHQLSLPIHPFDNFQTLNMKIMQLAPQLASEFIELYKNQAIVWIPQRDLTKYDYAAGRLTTEDLQLNWNKNTVDEYIGATKAGNPHHGGISVTCAQGPFQILQISKSQQPTYGAEPGTVLLVDKFKGWVVAVTNGSVSLDVVASQSGYFSGYQYAIRHGIDAGVQLI
ncbi:hypothetical protein L4D08_10270 [Photobacterium chitinilyticum]|uniref:methionyl-tRNA formyltransferase n=1 Tax=Photobacterium chitinilyticum TaxID=2485123 RepID=UPI003D0F6B49